MENKVNRIIVDWFSFTSKIDSPDTIINMLGLSHCPWEVLPGTKGFSQRYYLMGISIHFDNKMFPDLVWLEMSGQGCRTFEDYGDADFDLLFKYVAAEPADISMKRLDIAYDDYTGILDMSKIADDTRYHNYVSKCQYSEAVYSTKGISCIFGSPKSNVRIRFYDKAAEQNIDSVHWTRCELQLRDDRAFGFIKSYLTRMIDIGVIFSGVLLNYLRFVIPSETDSNKRRWETSDYWINFINGAESISVYSKPERAYNFGALENYVIGQAGQALKTYIAIEGLDGLQDALHHKAFECENPKYKELLKEYQLFKESKDELHR